MIDKCNVFFIEVKTNRIKEVYLQLPLTIIILFHFIKMFE